MKRDVKPRAYDSPLRREQARATRRVILDAARELFVARGYVATTIEAIAQRAGVSPETVYAVFGNKRSLLTQLVDVSIVGDDADVAVLDRSWVESLRRETDPRRAVAVLARNGTLILGRITPLYEVLLGAAAADRHAAAVVERYRAQRLVAQRQIVRILAERHGLRQGLTARAAADMVFTLGSPEAYSLLVRDRGWSARRFEHWYADALARLILSVDD